ncbi:immunity protein YezG family protein [Lactiplantibacillus herbarum]|uniref:immunity protein YezG family protein n=1 Tax=Lactiplantibacillus herbarum TaxID=1670446 RepID=UPI00064EA1F4|nr:immunity protein YezG family protein [Lactiplantibacillus herbarum]
MKENEIVEYYRDILTMAADLIPIEWGKLVVGANISRDDTKLLFFFYSTKDEPQNFLAGLMIPEEFEIDGEDFSEGVYQILQKIGDLQEWFVDNGQEPFYELMLQINSEGHLESEIGYIDWFESDSFTDSDQLKFLKDKYLGITPKSLYARNILRKMQKYEQQHSLK